MSEEKWAKPGAADEKVVNLCRNTKVPVHNYTPSEIEIIMVNPDGSTETVGRGLTCAASGIHNDKRWECWKSPNVTWKGRNFPAIRREDCVLPSYWLKWGWHFVRLENGRIVDFNNVGCTPIGDPEKFIPSAKRIMAFRSNYPTPDAAILGSTVKNAASAILERPGPIPEAAPSHGLERKEQKAPDAYQPLQPEFPLGDAQEPF